MHLHTRDLTGEVVEGWLAEEIDYDHGNSSKNRNLYWRIVCVHCGEEKSVRGDAFQRIVRHKCAKKY